MNLTTEPDRARILSAAVIEDPAHAVPLARALLALLLVVAVGGSRLTDRKLAAAGK